MNTTRSRPRGLAALVVLVVLAVTACAPGTPDEDSWRVDASRSVGDVASAVQTAQLALEQSLEGHLHHAYLQTVLVDAERTGDVAAQKLSSLQPPDVEEQRAADVDDQLEQANGLLQDARIAAVARDTGEYAGLVRQLEQSANQLLELETTLEKAPEAAQ